MTHYKKIILFSLSAALFMWVLDSALDFFVFNEGHSFWKIFILHESVEEVYDRGILVVAILAFGLAASLLFGRLEKTDALLQRANRLFKMLSECNQVLVRTDDETILLQRVCELIVRVGGYRFAWVGLVDEVPEKRIRPVAFFGEGEDFSEEMVFSGSEGGLGNGPVGRAIRSGHMIITQDIAHDPNFAPWRERALASGFRASVTLPIRLHDNVIGSLDIFADRVQHPAPEEITLLEELAGDLSYSVTAIRTREDRDKGLVALRKSEEEFRAICDYAPIGIARVDRNRKFSYINPHFEHMLGYSLADLADKDAYDITHPDDHDKNKRLSSGLHAGKYDTYSIEKRYLRKDGGSVWVDMHVSVVREADEASGYQIAIIEDITERKAAESARQRLAAIVDSTPDAIVSSDLERRILNWNNGAEKIYGYTAEEAIGQKMDILFETGGEPITNLVLSILRKGEGIKSLEAVRRRKDGSLVNVSISLSPIFNDKGEIVGVAGIHRDITELIEARREKERLETQVRQAQKMEALGTLAGGIAHDFNNILSAMIGYSELASFDCAQGSKTMQYLEQVLEAGLRAKNLVCQILSFSRRSAQEKKPMLPGPVVKETLQLIRATLPPTIEIEQRIEDEQGWILGEPTQIHQVIMNLCTNGAYAMKEKGGVLSVSVEMVDVDESSARQQLGLEPGPYIRLTVGDTGVGMDEATCARIFEPFFTTKSKGQGTGLGLAVVHGIVRDHGGAIKVYSKPGQGSNFHVYFPSTKTSAEAVAADEDVSPPRGTESILVVDDEPMLAEVGCQMLQRLGYRVTSANSGEKALAIFQENPDSFDLVLTDQTMPKMTGLELSRHLLDTRPDLSIILFTGFSKQISGENLLDAGVKRLLLKPFVLKDLAVAVREVLDESTMRRS